MAVPEIDLKLPRPVTALHQIETSSECQLSNWCSYCIHSQLGREKKAMTMDIFERALAHVDHYVNKELSQDELNLAGVGEPTLQPLLVEMVKKARAVMGNSWLNLTSNGVAWTEELAQGLAPYLSTHHGHKAGVFISSHIPKKAKTAIDLCRKYGMLIAISHDPAENTIDWAGQVDVEHTAATNRECPWIRQGRVMVSSCGYALTCCMDIAENSKLGHVNDPVGTWVTKPWSLCSSCDQEVGVKGFSQYGSGGRRLPKAKA